MSNFRHDAALSVPPSAPAREGWRRPSHGKGLLRDFKKGQSGYVPGTAHRYNEVQQLARAHSLDALRALVRLLDDDDGRVVAVASAAILDRAWGRCREMPAQEVQEERIDLSQLSDAELAVLTRLADSGRLGGTETRLPPQIEAQPDLNSVRKSG
jgi:hypothetical protein